MPGKKTEDHDPLALLFALADVLVHCLPSLHDILIVFIFNDDAIGWIFTAFL